MTVFVGASGRDRFRIVKAAGEGRWYATTTDDLEGDSDSVSVPDGKQGLGYKAGNDLKGIGISNHLYHSEQCVSSVDSAVAVA